MISFKGFLEGLGLAFVIMALAVSCEFCRRPDKSVGPYQWFMGPAERPSNNPALSP